MIKNLDYASLTFFLFFEFHSLTSNAIGDRGAKALGQALRINITLTTLLLGIFFSFSSLSIFFTVRSFLVFSLHSNDIGHEGAEAIGGALQKNCTLATLE